MSTIVKVRNKKSGAVYAYEQTAKWDPTKGQSRPVRKYLGRYDEEADTIIPTSGRRGRKPTQPEPQTQASEPAEASPSPSALAAELEALRAENARLKAALAQTTASTRATLAALEGLAG